CVVAGLIDNDQAILDLKTMQTGENYLGLWAAAREARPLPADTLRALQVDYKATQPIPLLAATMVLVEQHNDNLAACKKAGWLTPKDHPDLDPAHEALQLVELLTEMQRTTDFAARPADFHGIAGNALVSAKKLEEALRSLQAPTVIAADGGAAAREEAEHYYKELGQSCIACHKVYRNIPQKIGPP
ncbi:MAG TPA: hypothetical protein VL860_05180, partial [Planctomycetota bacterium]|nr:hypothetical protein [Planctomycetota bacterium]